MHVKPGRMLSTPNVETLRLQFMAAKYMKAMGERIAAAREAKGWNQSQLARAVERLRHRDDPDAANIDPSSISRYEKGKVEPSASMKSYLAEALGVPVSHFLSAQADKTETPDLVGTMNGNGRSQTEQLDRIEEAVHENQRLLIALARDRGLIAQSAAVQAGQDIGPLLQQIEEAAGQDQRATRRAPAKRRRATG